MVPPHFGESIISVENLDYKKPPPSLILKSELFAFLAIFARYPLDISIFFVYIQ